MGRAVVSVLAYVLLFGVALAAARWASPPAARPPFAGIEPISKAGLELQLIELSLLQSVTLKDGRARRAVSLGANVRAPDGGYGFTTERIIRVDELRDESGRDLLVGAAASSVDPRQPLYPFRGAGHIPTPVRGHACWASTRVEGLTRTPSRFSVVRGRVMAYKIAELKTFTLGPPASPEEQYVLRELVPGYWFSLDELTMTERGATWGFRDWQCNDVAPEFAGRPEVGRRRGLSMQFMLGDTAPSVPGYAGHDPSRPPFLQQIRFVTAKGKVLHRIAQGSLAITRPSGIYSEDGGSFSSASKLAEADLPIHVEVDVVVAVEPVALDFVLHDVRFGNAAPAAPAAIDPRRTDAPSTRLASSGGASVTIQPLEPPRADSAGKAPKPSGPPSVLLYDIDFEGPLHEAGLPPNLQQPPGPAGERSAIGVARRVPSANGNHNLPPPAVVDDSPALPGQVLRLSPAPDKTSQWIALDLAPATSGPAERFAAYVIEFDLVITHAGGPAPSFTLFADAPRVQPMKWRSDLTMTAPAAPDSAIGSWKPNELQRVRMLWDERVRMVTLTINDLRVGRFPYGGERIEKFRLSAGNAPNVPGEPAAAIVDNIKVTGLRDWAPELKTGNETR